MTIQEILTKEAKKAGINLTDLNGLFGQSTLDLNLGKLITNDPQTLKLKDRVRILAKSNLNVLILGETGTGKELIAQALHSYRIGPFKAINCGGVVDTLLESLFFGASKGSYTGCDRDRTGYFEQAKDGTIFLDEISELPPLLQCKLLRVIETKKVCRVGDDKEIDINCRIISATNNVSLSSKLGRQKSSFREDLYFRLAGTKLETVPLRERREDIRLIVKSIDKEGIINDEIIKQWSEHESFEGNIRELINLINEYLEIGRL